MNHVVTNLIVVPSENRSSAEKAFDKELSKLRVPDVSIVVCDPEETALNIKTVKEEKKLQDSASIS